MDKNTQNIYIYEDFLWNNLSPIVDNRPTFEIKCGIFDCFTRIKHFLPKHAKIHFIVRDELVDLVKEKYPHHDINPNQMHDGCWFLGNVIWSRKNIQEIINNNSTRFLTNNRLVGANLNKRVSEKWIHSGIPLNDFDFDSVRTRKIKVELIEYLWDAIKLTPKQIIEDSKHFRLETFNNLSETSKSINDNIYINKTADLSDQSVIDGSNGPVIIDKRTVVKPFCYLSGPLYIGTDCTIQPNSIIKGGTVIGENSSIGGEISQSIIQGFSNKSHFGYLGNSYLGNWINLGAGTTNSNLKNNYSDISITINKKIINTRQLKLGCLIGDFTRTAINTKITTGSTFGLCSNIVSDKILPKNINPFSWLVDGKLNNYDFDKLLNTIKIVKNRRGKILSDIEIKLLKTLYSKKK